MLNKKIINFLREKNWWHEHEITKYRDVLSQLNLDMESDFIQFYLHTEDGPTFFSRYREIYQLGWFLINTNLSKDLYSINKILDLPEDYIGLDSFEGEHGFFYNKVTQEVVHFQLGSSYEEREVKKWSTFVAFIEWYFNIEDALDN